MKKAAKEVVSEKIEETVAEAKKEIEKKAPVKKAAAKPAEKPAEKKTAIKKPVLKKTAAKKAAVKETVYLQYLGKEINKDDIVKQVKEVWTKQLKNKVGDLKSVDLYLKPEENAVYYVINGDVTGSLNI